MNDRLLMMMAVKYAQRRHASDLAHALGLQWAQVLPVLLELEQSGLVCRWSDGQWGLTPAGNVRRNELTASHTWGEPIG